MILEAMVRPIAALSYQNVLRVERDLGYRLRLNADAANWINGTMVFDMTPVWKKYGLKAVGVNYFTIGKVTNGISSRFDSSSPYYQSWLGGYIVRFDQSTEWTVDDHFRLREADQKNWLSMYGVNNPVVRMEFDKIVDYGKFNIDCYRGRLYGCGGDSNTDVGHQPRSWVLRLLWAGGAYFFNRSNPELHLRHHAFIPDWHKEKLLKPYQLVRLDGYVSIIDIDGRTKAVQYANSCSFIDLLGNEVNNFDHLGQKLKEDLKKFRIESTNE